MPSDATPAVLAARLAAAGCVAPDEEAALLVGAARGDDERLESLVERRCAGEPLAWLVGHVRFCGEAITVDPGVYVPRPQTEALARAAVERLPSDRVAVDLCTGSGAIAVVLARVRPGAHVLATDVDPVAVACATRNGVEAYVGDLDEPLPLDLAGRVDVVTAVPPYVPTDALPLLPRDVRVHEPHRALDGGRHGLDLVRRVVAAAARLLAPDGSLLVELGGDQADLLAPDLAAQGFTDVECLVDPEGDLRGVCARRRR